MIAAPRHATFTGRDQDMVRLLARGYSNREIANALGLSAKTVRNRMVEVYLLLGVTTRGRAILAALQGAGAA